MRELVTLRKCDTQEEHTMLCTFKRSYLIHLVEQVERPAFVGRF